MHFSFLFFVGAGSWQFCNFAYLDTLISGFLRKLTNFPAILRILRHQSTVYPIRTRSHRWERKREAMAANSNSAAAKKLGLDADQSPATPQPPDLPGATKKGGWRERWREREWVFRPQALKVKFKVKELEGLYKSSVFRSKQSLLFWASVLMAILSFLTILTYLGLEKVNTFAYYRGGHTHACNS